MNKLEIFQDKEFGNLPEEKKSQVLTNYFNKNLADDSFNALEEDKKSTILNNFISSQLVSEPIKETQTPSYNDVGNTHEAPAINDVPMKKESLLDKTKTFIKDGVKEAKKFLTIGADGLETGVNVMNPISPITGEFDIVKDTPMKKEFLEKQDENKIDDKLIGDIESLAKVDKQLFRDATAEDKKKYMENVGNVLARGGYALGKDNDGNFVAVGDDGKPKAITNGFFESIIDGLVADKGELAGAIGGAYKGTQLAKNVPTPIGKAATVLGSSAVGAMAGTALDTAISSYKTDQKLSVEDFLNELGKSAVLDVAGNAIGYGVIKVGGKVIDGTKELKDYLLSGNINGARKALKDDLGVDENFIDEALIQAKNQYKEVSDYTNKGLTDKAKKQEELLAAAQSNKKFGSDLIHDVVLDDVDAARNVSRTIDARTKNVLSLFDDVKVSGTDIKNSVKEYEDSVHKKYSDMRDTFKDAFSETGYRFDLKTLKFDETLEKLSEKVTDPTTKEKFKNLKTTLDNIVYDKDLGIGVVKDFDDLIDIRQMMNKFYRKNQGAFELKPDKDAFFNLVKNIDTEIESSVKNYLPEEIHKPLLDAFDNARMDYKQMYDIADTKLYKSLMADGMSANARMENLIKHTADDENEFSTLLKKLPGEQQEKIENSIVNTFLEKNLLGQSNEIQVIDYKKINTDLQKMKDFFITDSGKEAIAMIDDMSKKFGDDLELIKAATQAGIDTNAGIATTIKGRLEYKIVKNSYDRLMRLVPFSSTAKRLALQEHIKEALQKSRTPMEMVKRVARSSEIPADELASLKSNILDFNKTQRATRQSDFLKIEKEREAKFAQAEEELKNSQKLADENRLSQRADELTKNKPTLEELKAMDSLEGGGNGYFFANMYHLDNITPHQAAEYDRALSQYGDKIEFKINENKYPINVDNRAKIEQLKDYLMYTKQSGKDDTGLSGLVNPNKYKALMDDLSKGEFRNSEYQKTYYDLLKAYDEFEPKIKAMYDDDSFAPFAKFADNLAVGTYAGVETDEDGNITGFDPEKFVVALGGYTAAKEIVKRVAVKYKYPEKIATKIDDFIKSTEEDMAKLAGGGKPPVIEKSFLDGDGFYSVLEKTIDEKAGGKIDSISLAKMLENNGVKEDEIEWSGLKELMSNNEKLTKDEIENTIKENRLVIEKVEKTTDAKYGKYKLDGGDNYREYLFKQDNKKGKGYTSQHWNDENILVFTRVDDRTIDNKKTLFIEEIQSDWHQDGRKKGYRGSADIKYDVKEFFGIEKKLWDTFSKDTQDSYIQEMKDHPAYKKLGVPNAPFKKNWHELGIKRLIQEAVINDYEKLSWTTGTQQTQRYSLETTADQIIYNKNSGAIQVKNKDKDVFFKTVANDEELESIIGKEIANKLIKAETQNQNVFMLKGDELKFGGDGMKSFYDSILPNTVKKLFKKYQVKPKIEELDDSEEMVWSIDIPQKMKEDIKKLGQPLYAVGGAIVGYETIKEDNK